jgi:hypothetical protein
MLPNIAEARTRSVWHAMMVTQPHHHHHHVTQSSHSINAMVTQPGQTFNCLPSICLRGPLKTPAGRLTYETF